MYDDAMAGIRGNLVMTTPTSKIVHTGELQPSRSGGHQQQLVASSLGVHSRLNFVPVIGNLSQSKTI